ncbi:MAG: hypothetical protein EOO43_16795 [Flavobacterium sp.]|nr:MAG: hypothetical protein EOO43_16795 [Flavobacterium sp.]
MIYESEEGVYLFGYKTLNDSGSDWDEWYEFLNEAKERAREKFKVNELDWKEINDPEENCQHDRMESVRIDEN